MKAVNNFLTIGFWFGKEKPKNGDDTITTAKLDVQNLATSYDRFEIKYEEFKRKNTNNTVPYKNSLEEEECLICFPEPIGTVHTTFWTLKDMGEFFNYIENQHEETPAPEGWKSASLGDIFTQEELNKICEIYSKCSSQKLSLQAELKKYFLTFKNELSSRGHDAIFLSYAVSFALEKK
jgi:hypothetical protein